MARAAAAVDDGRAAALLERWVQVSQARRRPGARPSWSVGVGGVEADREGRFQVVPGVGAEGDVRLGLEHAGHLVDPAGDDLGDLLELPHPHDGDQVDLAGGGVDLADAVEIGDGRRDLGDRVGGGIDHHDGGDHAGEPSRARPAPAPAVTRSGRARVPSDRPSANGSRSARPASTRARKAVNAPVPGRRAGQGAGQLDQPGAGLLHPAQDQFGLVDRGGQFVVRAGRCLGGQEQSGERRAHRRRLRCAARSDQPAPADDGQVPAARAVRPGDGQLGHGGQRLQPLTAAHRPHQDGDPVAEHARRPRTAPRRPAGRPGRSSGATRAAGRARPPPGTRPRSRRTRPPTARRCTVPRTGPSRPARTALPRTRRDIRSVHCRRGSASWTAATAASAARRSGNGPRNTPVPGRTRRTTDRRGNGSSVSRTHSARSGNRERRLYRGLCSAISRSSRTAASRSCAHGIASTRWDSATISVIRLRCSPAEK